MLVTLRVYRVKVYDSDLAKNLFVRLRPFG